MREKLFRAMVFASALLLPALASAAEGEGGAEKFLGLPVDLWKTVNLLLILALLVKFLGKPLNDHFRKRREDLDERLAGAARDRAEAERLLGEMKQRLAGLSAEVAAIRDRGASDGETERRAQLAAAEAEAAAIARGAGEEIERKLAAAKAELARAAADLAAVRARDLLTSSMTEEDRGRFLDESVRRVGTIR